MKAIVYTDGASRGNPGPASCSAVILVDGLPEKELGLFLGKTTNNVAEYSGIILALEQAKQMGVMDVTIYSDSNLCVQQIKGVFKVSSPKLIPLYNRVKWLLQFFSRWEIHHVTRNKNKRADLLSNNVLDLQELLSTS